LLSRDGESRVSDFIVACLVWGLLVGLALALFDV